MRTLEQDLAALQTDHGVDDTMIESLTASPEQAAAHLRFWRGLMWGVNLPLLGMALASCILLARRLDHAPSWVTAIVFVLCIALTLKLSAVLRRQRRTLAALEETAHRHDLLGESHLD